LKVEGGVEKRVMRSNDDVVVQAWLGFPKARAPPEAPIPKFPISLFSVGIA